jgi:Na+/H+ antiporter NhaB
MRALFGLLVVAVIAVVAVGFYRGWFSVDYEKTDNKGQVTGTVDNDKIEADKKRAIEEMKGLGSKANAQPATTK